MGRKNFDKCMMDDAGDLVIFNGHYSLQEARDIIKEEYDEPSNWGKPQHIYVKFGFVPGAEDPPEFGFIEFDEYKKGRIKATLLKRI